MHTWRKYHSSVLQALLRHGSLKILQLSDYNDPLLHSRIQKTSQTLFLLEHKATCMNQDATCLPSEWHNLQQETRC